jgi:predicted ferric reductase
MRNFKYGFWGWLILLAVLWFIADPGFFKATSFFALRSSMVQFTGVMAIGVMSLAMILALRPRWLETRMGGLDKMYRLHKWLGIAALVITVIHWLWANGPKWAVGWGLLERPQRGPRPVITNPIEAHFNGVRGFAEHVGEWAFYAAVVLIVLALITRFPYRWFYKTHRFIAVAYLVLAFHALILFKFSYWITPLGVLMAVILLWGVWSAITTLLRKIGASRKVPGKITTLEYFPGVRALEIAIEVQGWPGHKAGQFAFATSDASEGPHPYTIASGWDAKNPVITFVAKELGDHTARLREKLYIGHKVTVEGPYGCFTFDDDCPHQIWIGGGIGITPFIARMKQLAMHEKNGQQGQKVDLFHTTAEVDQHALDHLVEDAQLANVQIHVLIDSRDGRLTGERIRNAVPQWRESSVWFCGPTGFGEAIKRDLEAHGFPVKERFHQELFAMR